jgi:hypothetical protein
MTYIKAHQTIEELLATHETKKGEEAPNRLIGAAKNLLHYL